MHRDHSRFVLGIFGGQGSGKTEYAARFIAHAKAQCAFVFDPEGEFSHALKVAPARTTYELDAAIRSGWVCYDPHFMFPGEREKALEYFCKLALRAASRLPGRKFLVIDELGWYVSGNKIPFPLKVAVQSGGRVGRLDCVFIGQQPNELHNTIRSQLTEVVCFQLTDDCALDFPKKFGFDVDDVRRLPRFKFICRTKRGGEHRG